MPASTWVPSKIAELLGDVLISGASIGQQLLRGASKWQNYQPGEINARIYGDDMDAVQTAATALYNSVGGGVVKLPPGTWNFTNSGLVLPNNVSLKGSGRGNTSLVMPSSSNFVALTLGYRSTVEDLKLTISSASTNHGILARNVDLFTLRSIEISGGVDPSAYALSIENCFNHHVESIRIQSGHNGVRIGNTDNVFNYGNSTFDLVEVQPTRSSRIGWYIHGAANHNYNLMVFAYCSCVTGNGSGSTAFKIRDSSGLEFLMIDAEGPDVSVDVDGLTFGLAQIGGIAVRGSYLTGDVNIGQYAWMSDFYSSRIYGNVNINSNLPPGLRPSFPGCIVGSTWKKYEDQYRASTTWDPPSVAAGAVSPDKTVAVTGIEMGWIAEASFSNAIPAGAFLVAKVTATDTVTVMLVNLSGSAVDLASGTLRVTVWPQH